MKFPFIAILMVGAGCVRPDPAQHSAQTKEGMHPIDRRMAAIEARTGGTLGLVLLDARGARLMARNAEQPMAFCSAFKFQLGAAAYQAAGEGKIDLDRAVNYDKVGLPAHSPILAADEDSRVSLRQAIAATITTSDNGAANLIITALGGPAGVTSRWHGFGPLASRLDRYETSLNTNTTGDPRDKATPVAMAETIRRLAKTNILADSDRIELFALSESSTTGLDRVRSGLPDGWRAGDKTGTCKQSGQPDQQVIDVGWIEVGARFYSFAIMVERPTASLDEVKAAMRDTGALMAEVIGGLR